MIYYILIILDVVFIGLGVWGWRELREFDRHYKEVEKSG